MVVIIMPLTNSLLANISGRFPHLSFAEANDFLWSPDTKTIYYNLDDENGTALLLHELGHAQLDHHDYARDIQLIGMEVDAWQQAKLLAREVAVAINEDVQQDHLDTYRDWLHDRSCCPECDATGHQVGRQQYRCLACLSEWRVNEARTCQLRRYRMTTKTPR
jgi:hypothetical protein